MDAAKIRLDVVELAGGGLLVLARSGHRRYATVYGEGLDTVAIQGEVLDAAGAWQTTTDIALMSPEPAAPCDCPRVEAVSGTYEIVDGDDDTDAGELPLLGEVA